MRFGELEDENWRFASTTLVRGAKASRELSRESVRNICNGCCVSPPATWARFCLGEAIRK